ncbi:MAG TPA: LamG domain-containing protein, partial [Chloroflexia bacterium]
MTTILEGLVLYHALARLDSGQILDLSGQGHPGRAVGNPQVVPDSTFGNSLKLDGQNDYVTLDPGSIPAGPALTVSLWLRPNKLPEGTVILGAVDASDKKAVGIAMPTSEGQVAFASAYDGTNLDDLRVALPTPIPEDTWQHWAFVKDASVGEMHIYCNGTHLGGNTGMTRPIPAVAKVNLGAETDEGWKFPGQMAHLRVYNRALSGQEIVEVMVEDKAAIAPFRQTYPFDMELVNDEGHAVLYITDDPAGQTMCLGLANVSGRAINLNPTPNPTASADNYHFRVSFRAGILTPRSIAILNEALETLNKTHPETTDQPTGVSDGLLQALASLGEAGWNATLEARADGTTHVYFLNLVKTSITLPPNFSTQVTLPGLAAHASGGARGTRVELAYDNLSYVGESTPVQGQRIVNLSILSREGYRYLPLNVWVSAMGTIANDGTTSNGLLLSITNPQEQDSIALNPSNSPKPSRFILSFDVQDQGETKPWALGTSDQVSQIDVTASDATNWTVTPQLEGESPEWIITTPTVMELRPDQAIELTLENIVTSLPTGETNLYLQYENIPGYWDGQLVAKLQKSPLKFSDERSMTVNADTTLNGNLSLMGKSSFAEDVSLYGNASLRGQLLTVRANGIHLTPPEDSTASPEIVITRPASATTGGNIAFLTLLQEDADKEVPTTYPSIVFNTRNRFWNRIESREDGIYFKTGNVTSDWMMPIHVGSIAAETTILRPKTATTGGNIAFLTLLQEDADKEVPTTYPSIVFNTRNRFWNRIESR